MRNLFLAAVAAIALASVGLTPAKSHAQAYFGSRIPLSSYHVSGYYATTPGGYTYYNPGYFYNPGAYYSPGYNTYYSSPRYSSYYVSPGYSSYYYNPGYTTYSSPRGYTYYSQPAYGSYYYSPGVYYRTYP